MQNNANIQQLDHEGKNCLNYAKDAMVSATIATKGHPAEGLTALVDLLIGLGCQEIAPSGASSNSSSSSTSNNINNNNNNSMAMSTSASAIV